MMTSLCQECDKRICYLISKNQNNICFQNHFFGIFTGAQWDSLLAVLRELFPPDTGGASDKEGPGVIASL
jgi:hypothetical protein